jgi:hypothetical protein
VAGFVDSKVFWASWRSTVPAVVPETLSNSSLSGMVTQVTCE